MDLPTPISNYSYIKLCVVYGLLVRVTKQEHPILEWNAGIWLHMPIEWNQRPFNANANAIEVTITCYGCR
jgi:hypothetical protein